MPQIGFGFILALDGVMPGGRARTQAINLRKDEPHPVGLLPTGADLLQCDRIDFLLGVEEALEIEWVVSVHCGCSSVRMLGAHRSLARRPVGGFAGPADLSFQRRWNGVNIAIKTIPTCASWPRDLARSSRQRQAPLRSATD